MLIIFISISLLTSLSIDMYLPSLVTIAQVFHSKYATVQLTMSVYLCGYALSQLIFGSLSEYYGRKKTLLVGIIIYTLSSLCAASANSLPMLIASRFIQGAGASSGMVTVFAVARDIYDSKILPRIFSYVSLAMIISAVLAPVIGGFLQTIFGWRSVFYLLALFGVILIFIVVKFIHGAPIRGQKNAGFVSKSISGYKDLLQNKPYNAAIISIVIGFTNIMCFLTFSTYYLYQIASSSPQKFGLIMGLNSIALALSNMASTQLNKFVETKKIVFYGGLSVSISGFILLFKYIYPLLEQEIFLISLFIGTAGAAIVIPNAIALAISSVTQNTAIAAGYFGFLRYAFAGVVVLVLSHLIKVYEPIFPIYILVSSLMICKKSFK